MNKKILMMSLMSLLMIGMVSAMSVDNIEVSYDKKSNMITTDFTSSLNQECGQPRVIVYDKKDNVVGMTYGDGWLCAICYGGSCTQLGQLRTGIFQESRFINLISKKDIKGLGNLRYEIKHPYDYRVTLAEGLLK